METIVTDVPTPQSYEVVPGWPALPDTLMLGEATGVGVDSHGHVFVFHRAGRGFANRAVITDPTILVLDGSSGTVVGTWGANLFVVPHGLAIDSRDHIWVTDVARHRVYELGHDGNVLRILGAR
ncbi:MAG: hypothetical protein WKG01_11090 [Kofleriaceae bacterium]